ncbi:MAG: hypothetical protein ACLQLG_12890, partial [Thermoguttaceae bacterium]
VFVRRLRAEIRAVVSKMLRECSGPPPSLRRSKVKRGVRGTDTANLAGKIKAINFDGRALVQFDGPDQGWHDIDLICLRVVPQSAPLGDGPDLRG